MRKLFSKFALVAALGLALVFTLSCSGGGDEVGGGGLSSPSNGGTSSPSSGGGIVNADNEAWVNRDEGFIFKQNGEVIDARNKNGNWCIKHTGLYSINGNQVTIRGTLYTYRIDVNGILSLIRTTDSGSEKQEDFIRTSGVYVSDACN